MTEPRVIFFEGMEAHEQRLRINPQVLGQALIKYGIDAQEAMNFDVGLIPSESALIKGAYAKQSGNPTVTTITGEETTLRDRVLKFYISPTATPSLALSKFTLLHEAGHMYSDMSGKAPERMSYYNPEFVDRVRRVGKAGIGAFAAVTAGYLATSGIDTEPLRTVIDATTISVSIPAGVCMAGAIMPEGAAWVISAEEWRAHAFALRNWHAGVIDLRSGS